MFEKVARTKRIDKNWVEGKLRLRTAQGHDIGLRDFFGLTE